MTSIIPGLKTRQFITKPLKMPVLKLQDLTPMDWTTPSAAIVFETSECSIETNDNVVLFDLFSDHPNYVMGTSMAVKTLKDSTTESFSNGASAADKARLPKTIGDWQQFEANAALFHIVSTPFDENEFTVPLETSNFTEEQIAMAERIASEIEASHQAKAKEQVMADEHDQHLESIKHDPAIVMTSQQDVNDKESDGCYLYKYFQAARSSTCSTDSESDVASDLTDSDFDDAASYEDETTLDARDDEETQELLVLEPVVAAVLATPVSATSRQQQPSRLFDVTTALEEETILMTTTVHSTAANATTNSSPSSLQRALARTLDDNKTAAAIPADTAPRPKLSSLQQALAQTSKTKRSVTFSVTNAGMA
ncbi:hypothetical protein MPSEU_000619100 [Mayamaea pseudoterrestris]|nr:hypothetical protein MPSEU_000619100 [Mayamaea pseudoterrestris]